MVVLAHHLGLGYSCYMPAIGPVRATSLPESPIYPPSGLPPLSTMKQELRSAGKTEIY